MDMSENNSNPVEWAQFYQSSHPVTGPSMFGHVSTAVDSTVVTTASNIPSPAITRGTMTGTDQNLYSNNTEGRGGRSARRRSRASRKAPTTLVNTDTTNFRAMVQQFTGVPSTLYSAGYQPRGGSTINYGLGFDHRLRHAGIVPPPGHFQQFQHQHQHQHQQEEGSIFGLTNNTNNVLLRGFNNPRANMEMSDGFLLDDMSYQMMPRPASSNQ